MSKALSANKPGQSDPLVGPERCTVGQMDDGRPNCQISRDADAARARRGRWAEPLILL